MTQSKKDGIDLLRVAVSDEARALEQRLGDAEDGDRLFPESFDASGSFTNSSIESHAIRIERE